MFWSHSSADDLIKLLPKVRGKYKKDEPLSKHTWFAVGGPAEVMFFPEDEDDLSYSMKNRPYNLPTFIIGAGSNLLVRDGGIPGVVIKLDNKNFKKSEITENTITLGAGFRNRSLEKILIENGIGGLEFLCSIPGLIGGSVKTNAGCYGTEVKDVIAKATIVNGEGEKKTIGVDDLKLSYRSSLFPDDWIITSITFKIRKDTENLFENSTSLNVGINRKDDIDIYSMVQKIDEGDTVIVVPKRISGIVKSRIYEYRNETDDLTLDFDTILYLRRPWTFEVNNQRMIAPPLTKIKIANVKGVWQADDGTQLLGVDILIYSDDKDFLMVKDVLIDYTDFILQFSYTEHPNNQELFQIALDAVRMSDIKDDMDIMKVTPDLVFTCEDCKYFEIGRTIAYIESVEKEVYFETDSHYYNYFCNTLDNIEIIWSEEFDL